MKLRRAGWLWGRGYSAKLNLKRIRIKGCCPDFPAYLQAIALELLRKGYAHRVANPYNLPFSVNDAVKLLQLDVFLSLLSCQGSEAALRADHGFCIEAAKFRYLWL